MKRIALLLAIPSTALAHPGHGEPSAPASDPMFALAAAGLVAISFALWWRRVRRT